MSDPRVCPIATCDKALRPGMLMCLLHWRRVPRAAQHEVWSSWRALLAVLREPVILNQDRHIDYAMARQAAIDAVERKLRAEATR